MSNRSSDHPEFKRLQKEDPAQAVTCPQCQGTGDALPANGERQSCHLCHGIGKVIESIDEHGKTSYRMPYFVHGPSRPLPPQPTRRKPMLVSYRIAFVPTFPGTIEQERLVTGLKRLIELGRKKHGGQQSGDAVASTSSPEGAISAPTIDTPASVPVQKPRVNRRRKKPEDGDPEIACPS